MLGRACATAGAGIIGLGASTAMAEAPPETTTIRLVFDSTFPVLCYAPLLVAEEFLRLEGFKDIEFVNYEGAITDAHVLLDGRADFAANVGSDLVVVIDKGVPVVMLAGLHAGCVEVFASDRVKDIRDLAGKRLLASAEGVVEHVFLSSILAFVGLDPARDVEWVWEVDYAKWPGMLAEGKVDIVQAFPPLTYMFREMQIGHVVLNTTTDDPWRNFFCCTFAGHKEFVRRHPVATKRAVRALVKANQLCESDREGTAQRLVKLGVTDRQDFALTALEEVPYGAWREYDPRDTMRFYALRLREAGIIKSGPREILKKGSDFRFLDEVRRELKT